MIECIIVPMMETIYDNNEKPHTTMVLDIFVVRSVENSF